MTARMATLLKALNVWKLIRTMPMVPALLFLEQVPWWN